MELATKGQGSGFVRIERTLYGTEGSQMEFIESVAAAAVGVAIVKIAKALLEMRA